MSFRVNLTPDFERQFKRLAKKYKSLPQDLSLLIASLKKDPEQGNSLGHNLYKIRLAIASKGKGKSGGARVITFLVHSEKDIYLVSIYDKSELDNITKEQVRQLLVNAGLQD